jgi:hypothetical protein
VLLLTGHACLLEAMVAVAAAVVAAAVAVRGAA